MSDTKITIYFSLFAVVAVILVSLGLSAFFAKVHYSRVAEEIVSNDFKQIVESKGHYVGWFGQCPYKKDDHYYLPCKSLFTESQWNEFMNSSMNHDKK